MDGDNGILLLESCVIFKNVYESYILSFLIQEIGMPSIVLYLFSGHIGSSLSGQ